MTWATCVPPIPSNRLGPDINPHAGSTFFDDGSTDWPLARHRASRTTLRYKRLQEWHRSKTTHRNAHPSREMWRATTVEE